LHRFLLGTYWSASNDVRGVVMEDTLALLRANQSVQQSESVENVAVDHLLEQSCIVFLRDPQEMQTGPQQHERQSLWKAWGSAIHRHLVDQLVPP
jgi:hypothetical protein